MTDASLPIIGVLGGMGPAATVDFLRRLIALTPAASDQDHLPVLVSSIPQIPDRTAAFLGRGDSPLNALITNGQRLVRAGASLIVMPCNTAHLWFEPLQEALGIPMLHIVDAALAELETDPGRVACVGLLATEATIRSGIYVDRSRNVMAEQAIAWQLPAPGEIAQWIAPGIAAVKAGDTARAAEYLGRAADALVERGATQIILGCTEIPLVLDRQRTGVRLLDANESLARRTVAWGRSHPSMSGESSLLSRCCLENITRRSIGVNSAADRLLDSRNGHPTLQSASVQSSPAHG
ncbi:aspartate/glutamate racemase family protein [Rhodanobacter sp. UC4436_H3]